MFNAPQLTSEAGTLKVDRVETKEVVVKNGEYQAVLTAFGNGVGLWMNGPKGNAGPLVAVYTVEGQTCVGLYGPGEKEAVNVGLTVPQDGDGKASIQFYHKGEVKQLSLDEVRKLFV